MLIPGYRVYPPHFLFACERQAHITPLHILQLICNPPLADVFIIFIYFVLLIFIFSYYTVPFNNLSFDEMVNRARSTDIEMGLSLKNPTGNVPVTPDMDTP